MVNAPSNKDIKGKEFFPSTIASIMEDEVIDIDDDDILDTKTNNKPEIPTKEIAKVNSESPDEVSETEDSDIETNLESTQNLTKPEQSDSQTGKNPSNNVTDEAQGLGEENDEIESKPLTITIQTGEKLSLRVLIKSLLRKETRPHIFLILILSVPLHIVSADKSLAKITSMVYLSLALSYLLVALLSNREIFRKLVIADSQIDQLQQKKIQGIKVYPRILATPLIIAVGLFFVMRSFFGGDTSFEFIGDFLPQALASLFLLWAIAQSRSFRTTAISFLESRSDKFSTVKKANTSAGYFLVLTSVTILGIALLFLFRSIESNFEMNFMSVMLRDWVFLVGLDLICVVSIVSTRDLISGFENDISKKISMRWILFCNLFVMWHAMTIYRKMVIDSTTGIGSLIEEVILMLFTVILAIWALTSSQTKSDFPVINKNNAIFVGISFGFAYAGSVAMLTSALDGIIEVISAGHAIAAISLLILQRSTIKRSLADERSESRIQELVSIESRIETNTEA